MTSKPSLSEDQFVDMAFITRLLGVSDKWIYRLIKDGLFPNPSNWVEVHAGCKAKSKPGCRPVLMHPVLSAKPLPVR